MIGVIRHEATRMGQLIDDLLAFSRVGREGMQSVEIDLTSLARVVFAECATDAANRKIRLNLHPLLPARGDPSLIRQVLIEILLVEDNPHDAELMTREPKKRQEEGTQGAGGLV